MSPKPQLVDTGNISKAQEKTRSNRIGSSAGSLSPVEVDLDKSRLSLRIKNLIRYGDGIDERYDGDHSRAIFAACHAMASDFTDIETASILTDKNYYLGKTAYKHTKTDNRPRAMKWIIEQNLHKARISISNDEDFNESVLISDTDSGEKKQMEKNRKLQHITFNLSSTALVENLIDHKSLVLIFGETNSGKTFFAVDLALHVAQGKTWQNRKVTKGLVIYVAAEGGTGTKKRIVAFRQAYDLENKSVPFQLASGTINLLDRRGDTPLLIQKIKEITKRYNEPVSLVIIDTLSRALSGGDENSSTDMGAFIKSVDQIREEMETAVMIVHHSGKNQANGARGHSLLKAAVDTEIQIFKNKDNQTYTAATTKQRDYEFGPSMGFQLEQIEIGKTDEDKTVTSCVVRSVDPATIEAFIEKPISGIAFKAYGTLKNNIDSSFIFAPKALNWPKDTAVTTVDLWREEFKKEHYEGKARSTVHSAFKNACKGLSESMHIEISGKYVRILEEQ
jgi:archaellum biogenesis ATPase FlaH